MILNVHCWLPPDFKQGHRFPIAQKDRSKYELCNLFNWTSRLQFIQQFIILSLCCGRIKRTCTDVWLCTLCVCVWSLCVDVLYLYTVIFPSLLRCDHTPAQNGNRVVGNLLNAPTAQFRCAVMWNRSAIAFCPTSQPGFDSLLWSMIYFCHFLRVMTLCFLIHIVINIWL